MNNIVIPTPPRCNAKAEYEGLEYAAIIDPGFPGYYSGSPDNWEPPEPGHIEAVFLLSEKTGEWQELPDDEVLPGTLEDALWSSFKDCDDCSGEY
jgi:hypothetical protein